MTHSLSEESLSHLRGLNPNLYSVVRLAMTASKNGFLVIPVSDVLIHLKTKHGLDSKHIYQKEILNGDVVALAPVNGSFDDHEAYGDIYASMRFGANEHRLAVAWGGFMGYGDLWGCDDICNTTESLTYITHDFDEKIKNHPMKSHFPYVACALFIVSKK